ncbi:addiction module family protein [Moheibacter lacus]|uniref:Addiction module family protein n=1 Tax=Moheibacter lacus TaxID=2745851 RepID=A0A838ZIK8_9FLAO|nr:addiction module family protein [Moheibacter lacus]MBA5629501.1 addiction module family protein [Moheibacter lacus]
METNLELKNRIKKYIDTADDQMLKIFNAIIDSQTNSGFQLSDEEKNILDQRLKFHQENPNDGKSWEEIKDALKVQYGI